MVGTTISTSSLSKIRGGNTIQIGVIFATKLVQIEVDQGGLAFEDLSDFVRELSFLISI